MSWWNPFSSPKPIYQDRDALEELTRIAEETAKKKREEREARDAQIEREKARLEHNKRVEEQVKEDLKKEKKREEEALDIFINDEYARIMNKKKPFKPF